MNALSSKLYPKITTGNQSLRPIAHCSRRSQGGFTLLELTIAMVFVAILIGGLVLTVSTSFKVWERTDERADLNQEARAVFEIFSRDIRGAYLGINRRTGYLVGGANSAPDTYGSIVEFTTSNGPLTQAALLPEYQDLEEWQQAMAALSDYVAVRYELHEGGLMKPGLYRYMWLLPRYEWLYEPPDETTARSIELLSERVIDFNIAFFDYDEGWLDSWITSEDNLRLPTTVGLEIVLQDDNGNEHVYQSVISIPSS